MDADPALAQARPSSSLFPGPAKQRSWEDDLTTLLEEALRRIPSGRVSPAFDLAAFRADLAGFDFTAPRPMPDVLFWVISRLETGLVHLTHPRYFGLFNPAPSFPSQCADRIAAAFNPQLATATTSPAGVELEAHVIRAVAARAGLPDGSGGHFTSGGSEANATALICALTRSNPSYAGTGARAFSGPPTFYVSSDAHLAWYKIAHQAGIGREAVRLVETDTAGRMDTGALAAGIALDRSYGRVPVMIVATAGTTGGGMIDPLHACSEVARTRGLWLHVDAAWGGGLIASDRLRRALAGIETADSVTIDAHKWFATTMGCGMFLTAHPDVAAQSFHVAQDAASFMPSNDRQHDPYVTSGQWSRRFLGLRLFLTLAVAGWAGLGAHVERSVRLARTIRLELQARGWNVVNNSPVGVVCAEPPPGSLGARRIVEGVVASGLAWVALARFLGREVIRICVTNGRSSPDDVDFLVRLLDSQAVRTVTSMPFTRLQRGECNDRTQ